jgi:hypothetical protein
MNYTWHYGQRANNHNPLHPTSSLQGRRIWRLPIHLLPPRRGRIKERGDILGRFYIILKDGAKAR